MLHSQTFVEDTYTDSHTWQNLQKLSPSIDSRHTVHYYTTVFTHWIVLGGTTRHTMLDKS